MKQMLTRLVLTLPVVWLVVSLVFLLIHLVPGDPILEMLGEGGYAGRYWRLAPPVWPRSAAVAAVSALLGRCRAWQSRQLDPAP